MLKLFDRYWVALVMILTIAALPMRTHAQAPSIIFSEVAWAGSSIASSDEWIELTNVSDEILDISHWKISGAGSSESDLVFPENSFVEPHSTYLISNYAFSHENTALAVEPNFSTASMSLPNGGFRLALYDDANTLIDVAGADGSPFAGRSGSSADSDDGRYTSMVRVEGLADGSLTTSWNHANSSQGFLEGTMDYGTPGTIFFATSSQTTTEKEAEEAVVEETVASTETSMIHINEFVVDPLEGENEWIELVNESLEEIDLTGYSVEDAVGKQTVLEGNVAPGAYFLIDTPLGKLNNDGDSILLKNEVGVLIDSIEYGTESLSAPKDGTALARTSGNVFELTYQPTPNSENIIDSRKPEVIDEPVLEEEVVAEEEVVEETTIQETVSEQEVLTESEVSSQLEELSQETPSVKIRINEFVTNPIEGKNEWIELYNSSEVDAILTGYSLEDSSTKTTDLSNYTLLANSYLVIESPKGILNNDGDTITLKNMDGEIVESVTYGPDTFPAPDKGEALARDGDTFELTQLTTPGSPNLIFIAIEEAVEVSVLDEVTDDEPATETSKESEIEVTQTTVRFTALYPNTTGSDEAEEYIEIENTGTESINLNGWSLKDSSDKSYLIKDTEVLLAGKALRLYRTQSKITLNNTGDTVELIAPNNEMIDTVTYESAEKGAIYNFANMQWNWVKQVQSSPTPDSSSSSSSTTKTTTTNTSSSSAKATLSLTVAQSKTKADGQHVTVKGVVTTLPGVLGSQIFYLEDETGGIQIYLYSRDFPELLVGSTVQATGELSTSRGERRIKLADATGVVTATEEFTHVLTTRALQDIDESFVGTLLVTNGQVQSKSATKLILETSGSTLTIYLNSNPAIDPNQFERGDQLTVTGVLTRYDDQLRLRPRSSADIQVEEERIASAASTVSGGDSTNSGSAGLILLFTTVAALGLLALWRFVPRRRFTQAAA